MNDSEPSFSLDYIAAGGNRHPSAADLAPGLLAFGAGNNIALWNPEDPRQNGIFALLSGHTDVVNAVRIVQLADETVIISGSADHTVRIWIPTSDPQAPYEQSCCMTEHQGSVNTIAVLPGSVQFATGGADGTVKIWRVQEAGVKLLQSISLQPRYLPLATAITRLPDDADVLAVAGTSSAIQLFVRPKAQLQSFSRPQPRAEFVLQATLTGHEGWIRSLDFVQDGDDFLLASASQDKYIRLWRLRKGQDVAKIEDGAANMALAGAKRSLSNKTHQVGRDEAKYNVTFEALLIGHEDWIYTARWAPKTSDHSSPTLLSASADNSIAVWVADEASGVWVCNARLGEISAQKGSTTATGSTGGFWIGLWQSDGHSVVSLGRAGSWRRWKYDAAKEMWEQSVGISGHTQEVQSLEWSTDGSYLLTTSSDQTTRLFAEWKREDYSSWREFARPQIHGYDLNCIATLGVNQFITGADEKLLRVFNKPKGIDRLLARLCDIPETVEGSLANAADIPVLGLSNKAIAAVADESTNDAMNGDEEDVGAASGVPKSALDIDHPPFEDQLARHTLWPEHEKLYGHGYEISTVAASYDGTLVATACKASSIDHAVIRLYETQEWREIKPPLTAHSLTVTSLAFSSDDKYLLGVGRDRQWTVFEREAEDAKRYGMLTSNPKGHTRMILDCEWAPGLAGNVFATAGRDKTVKIWTLADAEADCVTTITAGASVTAVAFSMLVKDECLRLAYGTEDGIIKISSLRLDSLNVIRTRQVPKALCASGAVNRLLWRSGNEHSSAGLLAIASDDCSIRILRIPD